MLVTRLVVVSSIASLALTACGGTSASTVAPTGAAAPAPGTAGDRGDGATAAAPPPTAESTAPSTATAPQATSSGPTPGATATPPPPPPSPCPPGTTLVKGGTFKIGPLKREVTTVDLCMDTTEVTAAVYEGCVKDGKCSDFQLKCADAATYQVPGKEDHPVVCVDHPQARAVCEHRGMRLPTENEWEWAARGGDENRKFAWGNDAPADQACWSGSAEGTRKGPCAVGAFEAGKSKDGLVDVTGNVFEWTSTSADGSDRMFVVRGGSWRDGVSSLLWNGRPGGFKPEYRCGFGGVRCVVEPNGPGAPAAPAPPAR